MDKGQDNKELDPNIDVSNINKHELYTGNIEEFRKVVKYINTETLQHFKESGKINDLAKGMKEAVERGLGVFPKICSPACEIQETCPFALQDMRPDGQACPIECYAIDSLMLKLQEEVTDGERPLKESELLLVSTLATLTVLANFRIKAKISTEPLTKTVPTKLPGGGTAEMEVTNPLIESLTQMMGEMQKVLKNLYMLPIDQARYPKKEKPKTQEQRFDGQKLIQELKKKGYDPKDLIAAYNVAKETDE